MDRQPSLAGDLVEARPLRDDDFAALYAIAADPLLWEQHPEPDRWREDVFRRYFDDQLGSGGSLAVLDRSTGAVIGVSRYDRLDEARGEVEIGWTFLARPYWGGAYNADLKRIMLLHAYRFVRTVVFLVGDENRRSRRAVEKLGAVETGRRRSGVLYELPAAASWRATAPRDEVVVLRPRPEPAAMPTYEIVDRASGDVAGRVWCPPGVEPPRVVCVADRHEARAVRLVTEWLLTVGGYEQASR